MNDLYIIVGTTLLIVAGFFIVPWLQRKGLLTSKQIEQIMSLSNIERLVVDILPIADKYKDKANFVLNVANEVIDYVNTYANGTLSKADKMALSLKLINETCAKFNVEIKGNEQKLIKIIIELGIEFVEKKN
ncbi:hypothetical protein [Paenibacillus sp. FSL H3-0333]|uniref:hypothetical protein n=1 Tax=Paenibacillus sp. FSL H3-0333 TaxID=2921373 RepID=UPI0030F8176A